MEFFFFYFFSLILVLSSFQVVFSKNPVFSVLFLVLAFCNGSVLLLLVELEFMALLFVVVYVGAIAVLFLFVVIMLDMKEAVPLVGYTSTGEVYRYIPICLGLGCIFLLELFIIFQNGFLVSDFFFDIYYTNFIVSIDSVPNIQTFGHVLYTFFFYYLIVAGLLLLLAIVGCVLLTSDRKANWPVNKSILKSYRRQVVYQQLSRIRSNAVFLVK